MDLGSPRGMDLNKWIWRDRNGSVGLASEWKPSNVGVKRGGKEKLSQSDITEAGWEQKDVLSGRLTF